MVLVYLLGIFMGAIDTGIVTPARTIIQSNLGVDEKTGIWMITIYTLAYAASIPIMGKLADKFGRKYVYLCNIFLFGLGSLLCGLSQNVGSFEMLLIARVIQAIGGGGILPVATAEVGTAFPAEKRGLALGLVGGVYGIANIFGSSAGSAILDIFGVNNWQFIFYINIPITIFILIAGWLSLPNSKEVSVKKMDLFGIVTLTLMVLSLLYGLKNIDFFEFTSSIQSTKVYPFLIAFVVLLPIFLWIEKKAQDPVLNISYFKNPQIIIIFILSFITGIVIMGMIFVPQFAENILKIPSGKGGYFVIILGVFAGISAPLSGKLIDQYGAKIVLIIGFLASITGALFLIFVTTKYPHFMTVAICLVFIGVGIGFTMGTPLNYMILENTDPKESNSALASISLIRSMGTAIAPAIMIGFIAHAGASLQPELMKMLPQDVAMPAFANLEVLNEKLDKLKENEMFADKMEDMQMPDLSKMNGMDMSSMDMSKDGNSSFEIPDALLEKLQASDVTSITDTTKLMATYILDQMTPTIVESITKGVDQGISGMNQGISGIDMGLSRMDASNPAMAGQMKGMEASKAELEEIVTLMIGLKESVPVAFEGYKNNYLDAIEEQSDEIEQVFQDTLNQGFKQIYLTVLIASLLALIILLFYKKKEKIISGADNS